MTEPGFVAETLAWCNERRAEKGLEPLERLPRGQRFRPGSCPCGTASGLFVDKFFYYDDGQHVYFPSAVPEAVTQFVHAFDAGELPQYDGELAG
jgi:hypothetical protein